MKFNVCLCVCVSECIDSAYYTLSEGPPIKGTEHI
jgi:hypothetical protein